MKKLIIAICLFISFAADAQEKPIGFWDNVDSTIIIGVYESNHLVRKKYAPIFKLTVINDTIHARKGGQWINTGVPFSSGGSSVSFGATTQIPFMNSGGTDFVYTSDFIYNNSLKRFAIGLPSGSPLAKISAYSATGLDTLLYLKQNGGGALLSMMVEANGDWWGNGYNVWRGSTAAFTGEIGNFNTRVVTPAINVPGGGSSLIINGGGLTAGVGIGGSADTKSLLDLQSTTKGLLVPRLTGAQMAAISSPPTSLLIWNTDSSAFCFYGGSSWIKIGAATGGGGSGTVTNVATGYGLSGGAITTTGTLLVDSSTLSAYYLRRKDSLTSTNPLGYVTKKILADSTAAVRSAITGGGGGATAAGNFGNLQLNRRGALAAAGSDSLDYEDATGLTVKNNINLNRSGQSTSAILTIEHTTGSEQTQFRMVSNAGVWRFMNGGSSSGFAGSLSLREENYAKNPLVIRSGADGMGVAIGKNSALHSGSGATLYVTGSGVGINNSNTAPTEALEVNGNVTIKHIKGTSATPSISAGSGVGTGGSAGATISSRSTDASGTFIITTGSSGVGAGNMMTVTFATAYSVAPIVVITPNVSQADFIPYVTSTTTGFTFFYRSTPSNSTSFGFNYLVIE